MNEAGKPQPKSDLTTRFVMGVAMVAVAIFAILAPVLVDPVWGQWIFRLLVVVAAAVMIVEWSDIHRVPRKRDIGAALMAAFLIGAAEYLYPAGQEDDAIATSSFALAWTGFAAAAGVAVVLGLISRRVAMAWGFLYIAVPAFALLVLEWTWFGLVLWAMIVTWSTDIFAYFAGRSIGGPKLAPRVSPNKTWAGLIGGIVGAAVFGWFAAGWFDLGMPFDLLGAPMAVLAQGGDLYESWVKRRAGIKDSGTTLPGHGGVLDRLDGLLPVVVATLALLMAGLWTG